MFYSLDADKDPRHDGAGTSKGRGEETPIPPHVPPNLAEAMLPY
jgi:hypothetical protein